MGDIRFKRRAVFQAVMVALALAPLVLYAYTGQFSRLIADDYCIASIGRELGAWGYMEYKFDTWAGGYADWFLKGMMAPLDTLLPRITPALIVVLWLAGLSWLVYEGLAYVGVSKPRWPLAIALAALSVAAAINAFYSPQSFYWYSASTQNTLSLALLTSYMALAFWTARQPRLPLWATVTGGALCFISAGSAEIFVAFQSVFLTVCLLMTFVFLRAAFRRSYALVFGTGWLATLIGLVIQLNAPGIAHRAAHNEQLGRQQIRALPMLLSETAERTFGYIGHPAAFAGFVMLMSLGLFVMLVKYRPQQTSKAPQSLQLALPPLWAGLIFQLLWLPLLWGHTSDNGQFLGRFSLQYMMIVALNIVFILGFLVMLWQRKRINDRLKEHKRILFIVPNALPFIFAALFMFTQLRGMIHFQALIYLFTTAFVCLGIVTGLLSSRFGWFAFLSYALVWAVIAAVVAVSLFGSGYVRERTLAFAAYLLVMPGLIWGVCIGYLLKHYSLSLAAGQSWIRWLKPASLAMAVIIGLSIVRGQAALVPDFQRYAQAWDARHIDIIARRDSGQKSIEIASLSYDMENYLSMGPEGQLRGPSSSNRCAKGYYGVDSIVVTERLSG